jgi:hypothetical protein
MLAPTKNTTPANTNSTEGQGPQVRARRGDDVVTNGLETHSRLELLVYFFLILLPIIIDYVLNEGPRLRAEQQ